VHISAVASGHFEAHAPRFNRKKLKMRNNLLVGLSSALATVAVAGSVNAAIVTKVDQFTTGQSYGTSPTSWTTINGSIFDQRNARRANNAGGTGVSATNNNVAFTLARWGTGSASSVMLNYRMSGAAATDLSSIAEMSIVLSALNLNVPGGTAATGVKFDWTLSDSNGNEMYASETRSTNGTSIFNFASATTAFAGFDLTQVTMLSLKVSQVGGSTSNTYSNTSVSGTLSDFNYTVVPAPGAAALVGLAGLMARRRRA
jgi:hypothetical protein